MKLFIRIVDGQPFEHPIFEDNFYQAFPNIDATSLPPEFAHFTRVELPVIGVYDMYEGVTYEQDGDGFKDVHHVRQMTLEEKTALQEKTKIAWIQGPNYESWQFDALTCSFIAPTPYPTDGLFYGWDELTTSWIKGNQ